MTFFVNDLRGKTKANATLCEYSFERCLSSGISRRETTLFHFTDMTTQAKNCCKRDAINFQLSRDHKTFYDSIPSFFHRLSSRTLMSSKTSANDDAKKVLDNDSSETIALNRLLTLKKYQNLNLAILQVLFWGEQTSFRRHYFLFLYAQLLPFPQPEIKRSENIKPKR